MLCLRENLDGYPHVLRTAIRKPVVEARNQLAKEVRELDANTLDFDPHYVLWVDDDAFWPAGHVDRAVAILEGNPDVAMVAGAFCGRLAYLPPLAVVTDGKNVAAVNLMAHEPGELIDVHLSGMHWNMIRTECLERLGDNPFDRLPATIASLALTESPGRLLREDESFTWRVHNVGRIVTERSLIVGHVDVSTGRVYMPNQPAMIANGLGAPLYDAELARLEPPVRTSDVRSYFEEPTATIPDATETATQPARCSTEATRRFVETALSTMQGQKIPPAIGSLAWSSLSAIERGAVFTEQTVKRG